jgi:hypothetical protein
MITLNDQIECAERELAIRKQVYPGWVDKGRMAPDKANHEIECMAEIVYTLIGLKSQERKKKKEIDTNEQ